MEDIKYTRFEYLSCYYKDLLQARLELNNTWIVKMSVWVKDIKEFTLWKVKWADDIANKMIKEMLDKMIKETEHELRVFLND